MHAIHLAKVVQGERSAKEKLKVFRFALPSRRLPYPKVVQGERSAKEKLKVFHFALSSRLSDSTVDDDSGSTLLAPLSVHPPSMAVARPFRPLSRRMPVMLQIAFQLGRQLACTF